MTRTELDRAPYVGPRPYAEDEREIFFGRDAEVAEVVSLVIAHRCVLLYAVSGAGKSSLLGAGVNGGLAEQGFEVLGPVRFQSPSAPPEDAANVFSYAVLRALTLLTDANAQPLDPALDLPDFLAELPRGTDAYGFSSPRVVILDQFEEIFTAYQERWQHREAFLRQLAEALDRDPELRIVLSMREEFIARLERYAGLLPEGLRARFHLERLRAPAALAAVTGPLKLEGIDFDAGVAETLVHDLRETRIDMGGGTVLRVEGEFVEPVQLQVVCRTLWTRLDPSVRRVTAGDLAALGNVDDSLTRYYDEAIAAAVVRTSVAEHRLRDELERLLITSAGTRASVFAGDKETAGPYTAALDELAAQHLIRAEWRAGGRWLELAHDRLIEPIQRSNASVRERHRRHRLRRLAISGGVLSILLVAATILASSIWFSKVSVPDVTGTTSSFEAEQKITAEGLALSANVAQERRAGVPPGTVVGQTPRAGAKVDPGSAISLLIAVGEQKTRVPDLSGVSSSDADVLLREAALTLGQASPQPVNRAAVVVSQIPAAGEIVSEGTPVDVFLERDRRGNATVPPIEGASPKAYAQQAGDLGLVPTLRKAFDDSRKGTLFQVAPEPGTKAEAGETVTLFESVGVPQIAYDNGRDVLLANGANGSGSDPIAKTAEQEKDPAFSFDGTRVAFTSEGQVFLRDLLEKDATPAALTEEGERFRDLAWAPTVDVDTLAMIKSGEGTQFSDAQTSLCFGAIGREGMETRCMAPSENVLGRKVNWSPDGTTLLVFGGKRDGTEIGMVQYASRRPFSADPADWVSKGFVTDTTQGGQEVLDAALSPDGKQLAVVVLGRGGRTNLLMTKSDDFLLQDQRVKPLGVRACKVIWRPDGQELLVVRADRCLGSPTGELIRVPIADPKGQRSLTLSGDNPVFQPLAAE